MSSTCTSAPSCGRSFHASQAQRTLLPTGAASRCPGSDAAPAAPSDPPRVDHRQLHVGQFHAVDPVEPGRDLLGIAGEAAQVEHPELGQTDGPLGIVRVLVARRVLGIPLVLVDLPLQFPQLAGGEGARRDHPGAADAELIEPLRKLWKVAPVG